MPSLHAPIANHYSAQLFVSEYHASCAQFAVMETPAQPVCLRSGTHNKCTNFAYMRNKHVIPSITNGSPTCLENQLLLLLHAYESESAINSASN
jgi:hypothetical protein